jgi:hypothetical protein
VHAPGVQCGAVTAAVGGMVIDFFDLEEKPCSCNSTLVRGGINGVTGEVLALHWTVSVTY